MSSNESDIIVYGGGFDPPHCGHVQSVEQIKRRRPSCEVLVVPGQMPAGSGGRHKIPATSFEHRFAMCEIAFRDFRGVQISRIEERLPTPNYSLQTLEELQKELPNAKVSLLLGQDQLAGFAGWHEPKRILEIADLLIMARQEDGSNESLKSDLNSLESSIGLSLAGRVHCYEQEIVGAQSRVIRESFRSGKQVPPGWLPREVNDYILNHSIYARQYEQS